MGVATIRGGMFSGAITRGLAIPITVTAPDMAIVQAMVMIRGTVMDMVMDLASASVSAASGIIIIIITGERAYCAPSAVRSHAKPRF